MSEKTKRETDANDEPEAVEIRVEDGHAASPEHEEPEFRFEDRRRRVEAEGADAETEEAPAEPRAPSIIDEFRKRADDAERQLQEYIEAFKRFKEDQEQFRVRMNRDIDRRVELKFGEVVAELLESLDDLDRAVDHAVGVPEARPLADGVTMARRRFLTTLERHGVTQISPDGEEFDPNQSEAVRVDPVESSELDNTVTEILRPGYRLGDRVIRPARVAVGRHARR